MNLPVAALGAAVAAGLASAPHCAAMCGPLAFAACGASRGAGLRYAAGRLVSYAITGAVAGALGATLARALRAETVQRVVSLLVAGGVALAAVRLARASSRATGLVTLRTSRPRTLPPLATGLATGVLPCGALAAGLTLAAGAATWWGGALTMMTFAAASAPGLAAAVLLGSEARRRVSVAASPWRARALACAMFAAAVWIAARPWLMPERTCCRGAHAACETMTFEARSPTLS